MAATADELADVLARARATVTSEVDWKRPVWNVDVSGCPAVLHRHASYRSFDDLVWELDVLDRFAERFPFVARPVRAFDGAAALEVHGSTWTLQELLPGAPAGWGTEAPVARVGAFLARFHEATRVIDPGPRPAAQQTLEALADAEPWVGLERQVGDDVAAWFHGVRERTLAALDGAGVFGMARGPIHGDVTVFNVLVEDGAPSGLVDFALCHSDVQVVDLAYAVWTWSRDRFAPDVFDPRRAEAFVRGYHSVIALPNATEWLPHAVLARALQLVARWLPRRPQVDLAPTLARLRFLDERRSEIAEAVDAGVR